MREFAMKEGGGGDVRIYRVVYCKCNFGKKTGIRD